MTLGIVDLISCVYFLIFPIMKAVYKQFLPFLPCLVDQFTLWFIPLVSLFLMATICFNRLHPKNIPSPGFEPTLLVLCCRLTAVCFPIQYPQFFSARNVQAVILASFMYSACTGVSFSCLCFFYHSTLSHHWDTEENEEDFWVIFNKVATIHVIALYSLTILGIVVRLAPQFLRRQVNVLNNHQFQLFDNSSVLEETNADEERIEQKPEWDDQHRNSEQ